MCLPPLFFDFLGIPTHCKRSGTRGMASATILDEVRERRRRMPLLARKSPRRRDRSTHAPLLLSQWPYTDIAGGGTEKTQLSLQGVALRRVPIGRVVLSVARKGSCPRMFLALRGHGMRDTRQLLGAAAAAQPGRERSNAWLLRGPRITAGSAKIDQLTNKGPGVRH